MLRCLRNLFRCHWQCSNSNLFSFGSPAGSLTTVLGTKWDSNSAHQVGLVERRYLSTSEAKQMVSTSTRRSTTAKQPILKPATAPEKKKIEVEPRFFVWLRSLPGFSVMPRQRPRRLAKVTFPHRLDRDETMGICYDYFDVLLRAYHDLSSDHSRRIPIIVTAAAPGSGKSFFLDEVGATRSADVDKFCKPKWAPALKSAVTISISFNGFSNLVNETDCNDRALCVRMLFSYFHSVLPAGMGFRSFFKLFAKSDTNDILPADCIEFIASHFVTAPAAASATDKAEASSSVADTVPSPSSSGPVLVLLMVDELAKSQCEDKILSSMGSILDESPQLADGRKCLVLPVFTSLHVSQLTDLLIGSQRAIQKVPFHNALKSAPAAMKALLAVPRELHPLIDVLCNDVGCHGRMLEAIADLLHPSSNLRLKANDFIRHPFHTLPDIHTALFAHHCSAAFFRDVSDEPQILINAVCNALLGLSVPRKLPVARGQQHSVGAAKVIGQLPTSQWTYDYLLSQGVFIVDADKSPTDITPVMSPLQLVKWSLSMQKINKLDLSPQMILFLQAIRRAFSARSAENDCQKCEEFHHDIEFIRRFALQQLGVRESTPTEFFKLDGKDYGGALHEELAACLRTKIQKNPN